MKFEVIWNESAESDLATIWLDKSLRTLLTQASRQFDSRLSRDPENTGESRDEGKRIDFELPFAIVFRCDKAARRVFVLSIWATR